MAIARRFLIASALTRLIRKERGSERVTEGHFAPQAERQSHVRLEKGQAYLVLTALDGDVSAAQDWTDVPRAHAEALLDVCPGTLVFERSQIHLRNHEAFIDRFVTPGPLDLVSVEFATQADADAFLPPVWFGSEVTGDDSYTNRVMAIAGRPRAPETPLSNAALETALDLLEGGRDEAPARHERPAERPAEDGAFERLRRLAAMRPASPRPSEPATPAKAEPPPEPPKSVEAAARPRSRRPAVPMVAAPAESGDDRLAGVIQGLSDALSKTTIDKDERFGS